MGSLRARSVLPSLVERPRLFIVLDSPRRKQRSRLFSCRQPRGLGNRHRTDGSGSFGKSTLEFRPTPKTFLLPRQKIEESLLGTSEQRHQDEAGTDWGSINDAFPTVTPGSEAGGSRSSYSETA